MTKSRSLAVASMKSIMKNIICGSIASVALLMGCNSLNAQETQTIVIFNYYEDPSFSFGNNPDLFPGGVTLGEAAHFAVLALGGSIDHSGPAGPNADPYNVNGDAGIVTSGQKFQASGSVSYGGHVYLHSGATFNSSAQGVPQPTMGPAVDTMLNQAKQDALNASAAATSLGASPTASYGTINSTFTISQASVGNYVFDITGINFSGGKILTLSAPSGSSFLLNVSSQIVLTSGSILVAGGLSAANVLINYTGTSDVRFSGGGNASRIDGNLLAPNATVKISPGVIMGSVIADDISMSSGADIVVPEASTTALLAFGSAIGIAGAVIRRRKLAARS